MSKILGASCKAGIVSVGGLPVKEAKIISEGIKESEGALLLEGEKATYITSNATDVKETIEKVSAGIEKISETLNLIAQTLTSIGAGMTGATTSPPGNLASDVSQIISDTTVLLSLKGELDLIKENLK